MRPSLAPTERGYPLVGVLPRLLRDPETYCAALASKHGDVVRLNLGLFEAYMISHPDHVKQVLQDNNQNYGKGKAWEAVRTAVGNSLPASDGAFWLRQRRVIQPAFHRKRLANLAQLMVDVIRPRIDAWQGHADRNEPVDLYAETKRITRDVVIRTMFSTGLTPLESTELDDAVPTMMDGIGLLMWTAWMPKFLPVPGRGRVLRAVQTVDKAVYRVIDERRRHDKGEEDLLSMLLRARDEETGEGMDDKQLHDEVIGMFIAGYEATSIALTWTWYALTQHPGAADQLAAEVERTLGDRDPTFEDLQHLVLTRKIFEEAMRIYPPGWVIPRQALADDVIGGYPIPKGALILLCHGLTHRRPDCWEKPAEFDPEHFASDRVAQRSRFAYLPFGGGPRQCIGNNFAMMEAQLILSMAVRRFRLELAAPVRRKAVHVVIRPDPTLSARLRPRA